MEYLKGLAHNIAYYKLGPQNQTISDTELQAL